MLTFSALWAFAALPLPYIYRRYRAVAQQRKPHALEVPFFTTLKNLHVGDAPHKRTQKFPWLLSLLWLLLLCSASGPKWVGEPIAIPVTGRDLIMAIDVSGSMQTPDLIQNGSETTRLAVVKDVANDFLAARSGDRVALILFGTNAYLQNPLTFDLTTVKTFLSEAEIGIAGKKTAIGDAIALAVKQFSQKHAQERVLILLTDGTTNAGALTPEQALSIAKDSHLTIYTIGIGATSLEIQSLLGTHRVNPSLDLDETLLKKIAQTTGGKYFRATDRENLAAIYQAIDKLEPIESDPEQFRPVESLFHWPLGLALIIGLIGLCFHSRRIPGEQHAMVSS